MKVNPFVWTRPIDDPDRIVGMDGFAREVALILKGRTNVALFGPRDTGKTTFTTQLAAELQRDHGGDAAPHTVVRVNLQRAFSIPLFCACVHDAMVNHASAKVRREARRRFEVLEKEIGFDIKVIKGSVRRSGVTPEQDAEALHAALVALRGLGERVVVIFDEFQRLNRCPGEPLSIIRSALMSTGSNHVSLLLTGSIREALELMLQNSREPIFGEAHQMELPAISRADFVEFLDFSFQETGVAFTEEGLQHILALTDAHPKRTQQLAWAVWNVARDLREPFTEVIVQEAYNDMLVREDTAEFETTLQMLMTGGDAEANEGRALFLLADRGGTMPTSRANVSLYGFTNPSLIVPAFRRLKRRGLADDRGGEWRLVDPFFAGWLRLQSPLTQAI